MFNAKRRDIMDFDNYMDLKKPGFGGPSSAMAFRDNSGKKVNTNPKLKEYQRVVSRDSAFSHNVYDPTYKAMTHDLVYKQEKKKPFTYRDPYLTAIPVVDASKMHEGKCYSDFSKFINEVEFPGETRVPCRNEEKAEDLLDDMRIDWNGWSEAPNGTGKSFTKDGDIVAYFDNSVRPHQLVVLPDAEKLSEPAYQEVEDSGEEEEVEDEIEDTYYKPEEEEVEDTEEEEELPRAKKISTDTDVKRMEALLRSFEKGRDDDEEEEEDEYPY